MWLTATARRLSDFLGIDADDGQHAPVADFPPPVREPTTQSLHDDLAEPDDRGPLTKARPRLQPRLGQTSQAELVGLHDVINELRDGLAVESSN
jgi:hypothetical protein